MTKLTILMTIISAGGLMAAQQQRNWQDGMVSDVQKTTPGTIVSGDSTGVGTRSVEHAGLPTDWLVVNGSEYAYTVADPRIAGLRFAPGVVGLIGGPIQQAVHNRHHGCRLVVGNPVKYAQEKDKLIVLDEDAKECRMTIVRQERIKPIAATSTFGPAPATTGAHE